MLARPRGLQLTMCSFSFPWLAIVTFSPICHYPVGTPTNKVRFKKTRVNLKHFKYWLILIFRSTPISLHWHVLFVLIVILKSIINTIRQNISSWITRPPPHLFNKHLLRIYYLLSPCNIIFVLNSSSIKTLSVFHPQVPSRGGHVECWDNITAPKCLSHTSGGKEKKTPNHRWLVPFLAVGPAGLTTVQILKFETWRILL